MAKHLFHVAYSDEEKTPDVLRQKAQRLGLSPEQYIRRLIARELGEEGLPTRDPVPGTNWQEYLMKNGVLIDTTVGEHRRI